MKAPSSRELGLQGKAVGWRSLPIHCKEVSPLDLEALEALDGPDKGLKERLIDALRWVKSEEAYSRVPVPEKIVPTRMRKCHIREMAAKGKCEPCTETPGSSCNVFTVPEVLKGRQRVIEHPMEVNDAYPEIDHVEFLSFQERHEAVLKGDTVADLDFSGYYDQFGLSRKVRRFYSFKAHGATWQMKVLPMGMRHSVAVAHLSTLHLLNFDAPGVFIEAYIDNVRFIGKREDVARAVAIFMARCKLVGATLNEVDIRSITESDLLMQAASLTRSAGDWLGESFDYAEKTVAISKKTRAKIEQASSLELRTWRGFAAYVSLLRYATRTTGVPLAPYFGALRAFAAASQMLSDRPEMWDEIALPLQPHAAEALARWTADVLAAAPRKISLDAPPSALMITDASDWGWGAVWLEDDGQVKTVSHPWTAQDRESGMTKKSVHAEPEAIYRALCCLVRPSRATTVAILTDNMAAKASIMKGYSPAFFVNTVAGKIRKSFPHMRFQVHHVAGVRNPVDKLSRGAKTISVDDWEEVLRLKKQYLN